MDLMPKHMTHEEYVDFRRRQVLEMATARAEDGISLLLNVWRINAALQELPELGRRADQSDILFLTGVVSESDEFPLGDERKHWSPNSLLEKDRLAQTYATEIRQDVLATFARIADSLR